MRISRVLKRIWHFIWEDNSLASWLVNVVLAFVLIKFVVYPVLGFVLGTSYPIVAVVSGSMEHSLSYEDNFGYRMCGKTFSESQRTDFEMFWETCGSWYDENKITKEQFSNFPMSNGFNKGDIIILRGAKPEEVEVGDVVVFKSNKPDPIIHRVVEKRTSGSSYYFTTKGDHNEAPIPQLGENSVPSNMVIGKSFMKVPFLGYIKIWFVELLKLIGVTL